MGFDYTKERAYKSIELIHNLWHRDKEISIDRLEQYGIDIQKLNSIDSEELVGINQFFKRLRDMD